MTNDSTKVRELPIPFSAPMVRAILDGSKTQTRRLVSALHREKLAASFGVQPWSVCDPYGVPGSRLWVREAWRTAGAFDGLSGSQIADAAIEAGYRKPWAPIEYADGARDNWGPDYTVGRYRHARFMPRWASRISLEVTSVRVERLQDIIEEDALAEGLSRIHHGDGDFYYSGHRTEPHPENWCYPEDAFRELWDSINGKRAAWSANPWVWVVGFSREVTA